MLKLTKRGGNGASQREREGGGERGSSEASRRWLHKINPPDGELARRTRTWQLFWELGNRTQKMSKSTKTCTGMLNEVLHVGWGEVIECNKKLKAACKRTQQLPTMLRQQCWEFLRACWQRCANGRNNSQQCRDLQCIVGRIQPIRLCKPSVMRVRSPNNVGRVVQTDPTLLHYASAIME